MDKLQELILKSPTNLNYSPNNINIGSVNFNTNLYMNNTNKNNPISSPCSTSSSSVDTLINQLMTTLTEPTYLSSLAFLSNMRESYTSQRYVNNSNFNNTTTGANNNTATGANNNNATGANNNTTTGANNNTTTGANNNTTTGANNNTATGANNNTATGANNNTATGPRVVYNFDVL